MRVPSAHNTCVHWRDVTAHRHGPYTSVVADTDQLRTSRLDYEVQRFLNRLPYEPGDAGGPGSGEPS